MDLSESRRKDEGWAVILWGNLLIHKGKEKKCESGVDFIIHRQLASNAAISGRVAFVVLQQQRN